MKNIFKASYPAEVFEDKLKELNIKYRKQYKDKRYPFRCDFYLVDFDIFIEINWHWSHGEHFFDEDNPEDLAKLKDWQESADCGWQKYIDAVDTWTKRDILKRDTALKNNLNYVVLWDIDDVTQYEEYLQELYDIQTFRRYKLNDTKTKIRNS